MTQPKIPLVCVIDDDQPVRDSLVSVLKVGGYDAIAFPSAERFFEENACPEASFLIVDVRLPGMSGIELLQTLSSMGLERPAIVATGHAEGDALRESRVKGQIHYLQKPSEPASLLAIIDNALAQG